MANTISVSGNVGVSSDGLSINNSVSWNTNMSGSNVTATVQDIALGSWQALDTTTLGDVRILSATNTKDPTQFSSSVILASDNAGAKPISILQAGDSCVIPWSGSLAVWARAYISASTIQYVAAES